VKNNYWRILGAWFLFYLTVYAINISLQSVVALVGGIIFLVLKFLNMQVDYMLFFTSVNAYASWPLNILSWLVISPIGSIMLTLLYYNQRFQKEGFDISLRLMALERNAERKRLSEVVD
jgi:hypothetical protein